mmetsp:Transcript_2104/g.4839  ORF Transcript_2104/g.4839 Transcript_2104/m.4839 type:complete len:252 (+) Transcript_2104:342-1097(+)
MASTRGTGGPPSENGGLKFVVKKVSRRKTGCDIVREDGLKLFEDSQDDEDQQQQHHDASNGMIRNRVRDGMDAECSGMQGATPSAAAANVECDADDRSRQLQALGCALMEDGNPHDALAKWREALSLTPSRAELFELMAQVLLDLGETWQAIQCATRATELAPSWSEAYVTLGHAQINMGEPELALESAQTALACDPKNDQAKRDEEIARNHVVEKNESKDGGGGAVHGRAFVTTNGRLQWKLLDRSETDL